MDPKASLGETISLLRVDPKGSGDDVIDQGIILYWAEEKRIITGADILGRLLRGMARKQAIGPNGGEKPSAA
jgi:hypothetical protein